MIRSHDNRTSASEQSARTCRTSASEQSARNCRTSASPMLSGKNLNFSGELHTTSYLSCTLVDAFSQDTQECHTTNLFIYLKVVRRTGYKFHGNHLCDSITLIRLHAVFYLIIRRGRSRSTDNVDSLVVVVLADTSLLVERGVEALAVKAGVESCFLPFCKDEVEPSLVAADGEATADAVDVFGFSGASRASENRERASRRRSDHGGGEHQDEKNRCGRGQGLSGGGHCKQKAVRFKQNSCRGLMEIGVRSCRVSLTIYRQIEKKNRSPGRSKQGPCNQGQVQLYT